MEKNIVPKVVSSNEAKLPFVYQFDDLADSHEEDSANVGFELHVAARLRFALGLSR